MDVPWNIPLTRSLRRRKSYIDKERVRTGRTISFKCNDTTTALSWRLSPKFQVVHCSRIAADESNQESVDSYRLREILDASAFDACLDIIRLRLIPIPGDTLRPVTLGIVCAFKALMIFAGIDFDHVVAIVIKKGGVRGVTFPKVHPHCAASDA